MEKYDVTIVGGSIAGSMAGRLTAEMGFKTLIVESAYTPREKPCSAIQFPYFEKLIGTKIPKYKLCTNPLDTMYMERPDGKVFIIPFKMLNFTRDVFDDWLNSLAIDAGAEFRDGVRCMGFETYDGAYRVSLRPKHQRNEVIETKYLVAADGLSSSIRKKLRPQDFTQKSLSPTINYYIKATEEGELKSNILYQFWNMDYNNLMFAWCYKKNDLWVVGTGHTDNVIQHCDLLLEHIKSQFKFEGEIVKREGYASRFRLDDPNHVFLGEGNLLFIGDAAGLVDMYRGLGMDAAALSGRRAAQAIYKAEKYDKPAITVYEKSMRKIVIQNRKNTENSLVKLKTNEELLDHMKRSSLKSGLKTMFFNKLNKILPANKIILLPK